MSIRQRLPAPVKTALKSWSRQTRSALIRRFFAFDTAQLVDALRRLGIRSSDTVMAHTSYASFEGFKGTLSEAVRALQEAVAEGNSRVGLENAGFVDPNGKFYSLKQAIRKFKIRSGFRIKPSKT